jgi:hypothetical protein
MIAFDLACDCGYTFEGWFASRDDFLRQEAEGLLYCPQCDRQGRIRKLLSPVTFQKNSSAPPKTLKKRPPDHEPSGHEEFIHALQAVQRFVEENFEDVGSELAQKAVNIHFGLEKPRPIRGVVSGEEEKLLEKAGIGFLKIPMLEKRDDEDLQ